MLWHTAGSISFNKWTEHEESWENPSTKRRLHSLIAVSGLLDKLVPIRARHATREEIERFHTSAYIDRIKALSDGEGGNAGDVCRFGKGIYMPTPWLIC
jgi:acetoin utilization deacetylase AcuC-like enzyme